MSSLVQGPRNKSVHTQTFELLIKLMIHNPSSVTFEIKEREGFFYGKNPKRLVAHIGNKQLDLTELLEKVNFNHLSFTEEDCKHSGNHESVYSSHFRNTPSKYDELHTAEKRALIDFTGSSWDVNTLLHKEYNKHQDFRKLLLKIALVASGLNKISPESADKKFYRGENSTSKQEVELRKQVIGKESPYTQELAFKSTSSSYQVAKNFSGKNVMIHYYNSTGKDISELSYFKGEREYLLNIEKILWEHYKREDDTHVFHATIINPLDPRQDESNAQENAALNKLLRFGEQSKIDLSFMTGANLRVVGFAPVNDLQPDTVVNRLAALKERSALLSHFALSQKRVAAARMDVPEASAEISVKSPRPQIAAY